MPSWRTTSWINHKNAPATAAPVSAPAAEIDEDPFPCTQCAKGFTSQRGLSRHITAVHVEASPLD